jgi:hypothetical protein
VIRETQLVEEGLRAPMIGSVAFDRNPFRDLPVDQRVGMKEREKELGDAEGNWMATGIVIDPLWGGKGIITVSD